MPAQFQLDTCIPQLARSVRVEIRAGLTERHARPSLGEQQRGGDAAACRSNDRHVLSAHRETHLSFKLVRLKSAKMMAAIMNRAITFGSLQPISSKWWCRGAILKTRLPVELERRDLNDHRRRFEHEHAADDVQQDFLLDENRHGREGAAERERSDIAHEDVRGVELYQRKPRLAPTSEPQKMVSSADCGKWTRSRYSARMR